MKLFLVLSAVVLAVTALPLQDKAETTLSPIANDEAVTTEISNLIARQEEEGAPTGAPAPAEVSEEAEEDEEEDSPATTLRTQPDPQPQPPKRKVPIKTSFAQEWAIVTGTGNNDIAPNDQINRNVVQQEKVLTV